MAQYELKGTLAAGTNLVPLGVVIDVLDDKTAIQEAQKEAQRSHELEGYAVVLHIFNQTGRQVGTVVAPKPGQTRPCEDCRKEGKSISARYREVYNDLTGTDVCKRHLMNKRQRREWSKNGLLERLHDYNLRKEVDSITLQ